MADVPDNDVEALEFLIDTLVHDLNNYQELAKKQAVATDNAKVAVDTARKNLRYLKKEAPVVKMTEYLTALRALERSQERLKTTTEELKTVRKLLKDTESDLAIARKALQDQLKKVESPPRTTAKILEFKRNDSGRNET